VVSIWSRVKKYFSLRPEPKAEGADREAYIAEQELIDTPWATFEVRGFEDDGRIKVEFNWNSEFIRKIKDLGFQAETEEDSVQLFFYASQMKPTELSVGDDPVQSEEHPQLSSQQNVLRT
jgi:hypothetical protein